MDRPSWNETIFKVLEQYKQRSHDSQTKYGCALIDPQSHRIMSIGMNGACPDMWDEQVPNVRPEKYGYMHHSEDAALYGLLGTGISPKGLHCYVDGWPCIKHEMMPGCLQKLYYNGITTVVIKPHVANMVKSFDNWLNQFNDFQTKCKKKIFVYVVDEKYDYKTLDTFVTELEQDVSNFLTKESNDV